MAVEDEKTCEVQYGCAFKTNGKCALANALEGQRLRGGMPSQDAWESSVRSYKSRAKENKCHNKKAIDAVGKKTPVIIKP